MLSPVQQSCEPSNTCGWAATRSCGSRAAPVYATSANEICRSARMVRFAGVNYSGAICYDYGFPEIASDAYGRVLGSLRADGASDGVLVASVPAARVPTLFFRTGDLLPLAAIALCLLVLGKLSRSVGAARAKRRTN